MTAGERAKWTSATKHVGMIIDKLSPEGDTPFLKDMEALRDELDEVLEKSGTDAQELGEQLGSAVSGLLGAKAIVNVYVTINGGQSSTPSFTQNRRHE